MVHEKGIVYRDIKPENFVVGRHSMKKNNRIYIIGDTMLHLCDHEDSTNGTAVFVLFDTFFQYHHYLCALQLKRVCYLKIEKIRNNHFARSIYTLVRVSKRFVFILRISKNINIRLVSESNVG